MLTWRQMLEIEGNIHHRACGGKVEADGWHSNRFWYKCRGCNKVWAGDTLELRTVEEINARFELRDIPDRDTYRLMEAEDVPPGTPVGTRGRKRFHTLIKRRRL